jgi:hypothetical protein
MKSSPARIINGKRSDFMILMISFELKVYNTYAGRLAANGICCGTVLAAPSHCGTTGSSRPQQTARITDGILIE